MKSTSFTKMVGLAGLASLIVNTEGIILLPILTKTLGLRLYGIWALVNAMILLAGPIATLGLNSGITRLLASITDKKKLSIEFFSIFFIILITGSAIAISVFLTSNLFISSFMEKGDAPYFMIGSGMIILWAARQILLTYFQIFRQMEKYIAYVILYFLGEIGLISYFVWNGYGLSGALAGVILANLLVVLLMLSNILGQIGFSGIKVSQIREYFAIGLPYVPMILFIWIMSTSNRYFIGIFQDASMVGLFSTTYSLTTLVMIFISAITFALEPTISKLRDEEEIGAVRQYLSQSLKFSMLFIIPCAVGISVLGESILQTMTKPEFTPGAVIIPILSIGMISHAIFSLFSSVLLMAKRTIYTTYSTGVAAILNIVLNIILIPSYGIWGAAITTMITYMALMFMGFYFSRKYLKFDMNVTFIFKSVIVSMIMALVILQIHPVGILQLIMTSGIGAVVYGIGIILMKGFTKDELGFFRSLLKDTTRKR